VAAGAGRRGAPHLRQVLHQDSYAVTDSTLERRFLALARRAGLPKPLTQVRLDGHRVDFYWPELGLVVETDGLRYHRTAAQQAKDRRRDQAHTAAGRTVLRFTHAQVVREAAATVSTLVAVARRCGVR
jgi:very-short-patch-repair endonuclease